MILRVEVFISLLLDFLRLYTKCAQGTVSLIKICELPSCIIDSRKTVEISARTFRQKRVRQVCQKMSRNYEVVH